MESPTIDFETELILVCLERVVMVHHHHDKLDPAASHSMQAAAFLQHF
jgi:hypothetical protein